MNKFPANLENQINLSRQIKRLTADRNSCLSLINNIKKEIKNEDIIKKIDTFLESRKTNKNII